MPVVSGKWVNKRKKIGLISGDPLQMHQGGFTLRTLTLRLLRNFCIIKIHCVINLLTFQLTVIKNDKRRMTRNINLHWIHQIHTVAISEITPLNHPAHAA